MQSVLAVGSEATLRAAYRAPGGKDGVVDPGTGSMPDGMDKLTTLVEWVAWSVLALCVVGILLVAGKMAVSHQRGQGGEHATGLAYVLGACVLVGAASSLVGALAGG